MFTMDNTDGFSARDLRELNAALDAMLADVDDDMRADAEKNYSDRLNNAWFDGATAADLLRKVGHQ